MSTDINLHSVRQSLFVDKNPDAALALMASMEAAIANRPYWEKRPFWELRGYAYQRLNQHGNAAECFSRILDNYLVGYSHLLAGQLDATRLAWQSLLNTRQNHWCLTLFGLVSRSLNSVPTFLQIRNHLEGDIINLFRAGQVNLVQNMLQSVKHLTDINFEAYKFAGRALYHVGEYEQAQQFLLQGQKILPNDPEVYYHLGQSYYATQRYDEARLMLHQCLLISAYYTPAKELIAKMPHEAA